MNRRQFLRALPAAVAGIALTDPSKLLAPAPLQFHPQAFTLAMDPLTKVRIDVLCGWATVRPELACRVIDDNDFEGAVLSTEETAHESGA